MTQSWSPLRWSVIGHIYNKSLQNDEAEKPSSLSSAQWHRSVKLLWRHGLRAERPCGRVVRSSFSARQHELNLTWELTSPKYLQLTSSSVKESNVIASHCKNHMCQHLKGTQYRTRHILSKCYIFDKLKFWLKFVRKSLLILKDWC